MTEKYAHRHYIRRQPLLVICCVVCYAAPICPLYAKLTYNLSQIM